MQDSIYHMTVFLHLIHDYRMKTKIFGLEIKFSDITIILCQVTS